MVRSRGHSGIGVAVVALTLLLGVDPCQPNAESRCDHGLGGSPGVMGQAISGYHPVIESGSSAVQLALICVG
jgi:hypothetical protein